MRLEEIKEILTQECRVCKSTENLRFYSEKYFYNDKAIKTAIENGNVCYLCNAHYFEKLYGKKKRR